MYGHGQDPAPSGGQQSAFSHPPHLSSYSSAGSSSMGAGKSAGSPGRFSPGHYGVGYPGSHLGVMPSSHHGAFHAGGRDAGNVGPAPGFSSPWSPHYTGNMPGSSGPTGSPLVRSTSRAASMEEDGEQGHSDEDEDEEEDDSEDSEDDDDDDADGNGRSKKRKRGGANSNGAKANAKGASSNAAAGNAAGGKKPKPTRGAKACTHCRRLKMRCVGAEEGPPCARCRQTGHDCIFEESNRGKKGGKSSQQRTEAMWQSLRKMEATLNTVLAGLRAQGATAAGAALTPGAPLAPPSHPLSSTFARPAATSGPSSSTSGPSAIHRARFVEPERSSAPSMPALPRSHSFGERPPRASSPRLHQLPDNTLNPLGLLAEASLHNHSRLKRTASNANGRGGAPNSTPGSTHSRTERSASGSAAGMSPNNASGSLPSYKAEDGGDTSGAVAAHVSTPAVEVDLEKDPAAAAEARALDSLVSKSRSSVSGTGDGGVSGNGTGGAAAKGQEEKEADEAVAATMAAESAGSATQAWPKLADAEKPQLGVASDAYFRPGPMTILPLRRIIIEREMPPELLTEGIVSSKEVLELFRIFFHYCAQHVILLDPDWHTPTMICSRSPFLFTCILAVASKFYLKRPDLYASCLAKARKSAFIILSRGFKSVEICQGLLLLTLWNQPAERYETDRTWLFSGIAIRMATDLNLHRKTVPPPGTSDEAMREILNRERTWLYCFSVDRSLSNQTGKPWTIREDWIIRNSRDWGNQKLSQPSDRALSAIVELLRLTSRQLDFLYSSTTSASGLNTDIDYSTIIGVYNQQLDRWAEEWSSLSPSGEHYDPEKDDEDHTKRTLHFLSGARPMRFYYASLCLNSFGLQHSVDYPVQSGLDKAFYYAKCHEAAKNIIMAARDRMAPVLGYAPDTIYVILAYACVFLLKLARPAFADFADEETIVSLVTEGANLMERVAMHPTHTPALYASFLRALLHSRTELASRSGYTTPYRSRAASPLGQDEGEGKTTAEEAATAAANGEAQGYGSGNTANGGAQGPSHSEAHSRRASMAADMAHTLPGGFSGLASTLPGGTAGAVLGAFGNMPGEQAAANNTLDPSLAAGNNSNAGAHGGMQDFLQNNWWSSLLPPGFGGPLEGLSGLPGTFSPIAGNTGVTPSAGILHSAGGLGAGMTPGQTRANSPSASIIPHFGTNLNFDFSTPGPGPAP